MAKFVSSNNLQGGFPFEAAVSVMHVVKPLKVLALPFEHDIARKPLAAEKFLIVCIVEVLYYTITPWFAHRDKDRMNAEVET